MDRSAPKAPLADDLWGQALQGALCKLPVKDAQWLADGRNQKAFTSTEIFEAIRPFHDKYCKHPAQRLLARIDPIVSHIRSFAAAINSFANANPTGAGVVWGGIHLVLLVRALPHLMCAMLCHCARQLTRQLRLHQRRSARWRQS
jgi:hypothetical protein